MSLLAILVVFAALSYWAGFKARPHALQYLSRVGFLVALGLIAFVGYFQWRELRVVSELSAFVDPPPGIRGVVYVPTAGEMAAVTGVLGGDLSEPAERGSADEVSGTEEAARYWMLETSLTPDSVLAFHRASVPERGWSLADSSEGGLVLEKASTRIAVFVRDNAPRPGTTVVYATIPSR